MPAAGRSQKGSCSCTTMPQLTGHLQPRRNWPTWGSVLITHPILLIWPHWTTTCSLDWKNNWKVTIFRPTWRSLLLRRPGWTFRIFFSGLQKLEQWAKKRIEVREEYAEYIPSLVAVDCFLPGRAKDLSAPSHIQTLIYKPSTSNTTPTVKALAIMNTPGHMLLQWRKFCIYEACPESRYTSRLGW